MTYLVIETHGGAEYAIIVTDKNGQNKVLNNIAAAEAEATDCQDGIVIEI